MHRSTDNESAGIRAAMVYHYAAAGSIDHSAEHWSSSNAGVPVRRHGRVVPPARAPASSTDAA